jgi:hypothetical protein
MTSLVEIRRKYPQYNDMSDQQLADAMHAKHYSDMDKAVFYDKIGYRPKRTAMGDLKEGWDKANKRLAQPFASINPGQQGLAALDVITGATKAAGAKIGEGIHAVTGGKSLTGKGNAPMETKVVDGKKYYRWNGEGDWKLPPDSLKKPDGTYDDLRLNAYFEAERPMMTTRSVQDKIGDPIADLLTFFSPGGKTKAASEAASKAAKAAETVGTAAKEAGILARNAERLQNAGVTPYRAIADGGKGKTAVTNMIAENAIGGVKVRQRLQQSVNEVEEGAGLLARKYGQARGSQIVGEGVQEGVKRFANGRVKPPASVATPAKETSFRAKSETVYKKAFEPIIAAEDVAVTANANRAQLVQGGARPVVVPEKTMAVLGDITGRVNSPELAKILAQGRHGDILEALRAGNRNGSVRFNDIRQLRTSVREAQRSPELRASLGEANLQRLESALTEDIYKTAETLAGPQAMQRLRRADEYYRAGSERIKTALQPFADAKSGEGAYSRLMNMAGSGASADGRSLIALKRSLKGEEWGDVAANVVSEMGKASPGARAVDASEFSISTFVTNYNKLSPKGKDVLFGSAGGGGAKATELRRALDELAWAADQVKRVERGANASKSGVSMQTWGTVVGLANPATAVPTATGVGGLFLTGELLTNPKAIRILTRGIKQGKTEQQVIKDLSNVIDITPYLKASGVSHAVEGQAAQLAPQVAKSVAQPQTPQEDQQP